jgi:hypothetical protein
MRRGLLGAALHLRKHVVQEQHLIKTAILTINGQRTELHGTDRYRGVGAQAVIDAERSAEMENRRFVRMVTGFPAGLYT